MKRYVSVFQMIARCSIYKVLAVIGAMLAAQGVCFYLSMISPSGIAIEEYIDQSQYNLIFQMAYVMITILLVLPGMDIGSKQSYTLQRLRIKEKRIFWLQALYNLMAYVLLWGAQLVMLFVSTMIYHKFLPDGIKYTNQTMFIAFHRNDFMHNILPLEDVYGWTFIILIGVSSAFTTAMFTKLRREENKFGLELLLLVAAVLIYFPRDLGYEIYSFSFGVFFVFAIMGFRAFMKKILEVNSRA